jgi:hypothetical protein
MKSLRLAAAQEVLKPLAVLLHPLLVVVQNDVRRLEENGIRYVRTSHQVKSKDFHANAKHFGALRFATKNLASLSEGVAKGVSGSHGASSMRPL